MKVEFWCDSGANIYSRKKEILDTVKDLGLEEGEWEELSEGEKYEFAEEWAYKRLQIGFREIEE